jgi:hypothetical protein
VQFDDWQALDDETVSLLAPDGPGAVQLSRRDRSLVAYPTGKSAMVFYFYAARSVKDALRKLFADELLAPGARGEGPLLFRCCPGGAPAQTWLEGLFDDFVEQFGRAPILHPDDDDDDDDDRG